jgi:hypothetical protein
VNRSSKVAMCSIKPTCVEMLKRVRIHNYGVIKCTVVNQLDGSTNVTTRADLYVRQCDECILEMCM